MFSQDDFIAFVRYANRERSLDASLRAAHAYGSADDQRASVAALRELNKHRLFRETDRSKPPRD